MFTHFDDDARIWIYGFSKPLSDENMELVKSYMKDFTRGWVSHGDQVLGDFEIVEKRFVFLVAENTLSGCSIDGSVDLFRKIRALHGLDALNQNLIFYRDDSRTIRCSDRLSFQREVQQGRIDENTPVFDLSFASLGDLRKRRFELPAGESWHGRVFSIPAKKGDEVTG